MGTFGDIACFSLSHSKDVPTFGGGILTTNNTDLFNKIQSRFESDYAFPRKMDMYKMFIKRGQQNQQEDLFKRTEEMIKQSQKNFEDNLPDMADKAGFNAAEGFKRSLTPEKGPYHYATGTEFKKLGDMPDPVTGEMKGPYHYATGRPFRSFWGAARKRRRRRRPSRRQRSRRRQRCSRRRRRLKEK